MKTAEGFIKQMGYDPDTQVDEHCLYTFYTYLGLAGVCWYGVCGKKKTDTFYKTADQ